MAGPQLTSSIIGSEKLASKLESVSPRLPQIVKNAANMTRDEVKKFAKPHAADKGTLAEGMKVEFLGGALAGGGALSAWVKPAKKIVGIAAVVEVGRRPGMRPAAASLERWMISHGIAGSPWKLAQEIGISGTEGVRFMEKGEQAARLKLPAIVGSAKAEILKGFA